MKHVQLSLAVLAIAAASTFALAQAPPPEGSAAPMEGPAEPSMTLAQFQASQRERMMRMDTDHDGRISLAEWMAWRGAHPGHGGPHGDPERMFQRMDLNHDGYITPDEIDAASARRFERMDANHDGVVTPDERAAMHHDSGG